jgi:hypothetical protein
VIWQSCSLVIAATPSIITLMFGFSLLSLKMERHFGEDMFIGSVAAPCVFILDKIFVVFVAAYITARLLLITLSFTTLRALPAAALVDVNWSTYIPHF